MYDGHAQRKLVTRRLTELSYQISHRVKPILNE